MRGWWREIADLVLPLECAGCGGVRGLICGGCRAALGGAASARRVLPSPVLPGLPVVHAAAAYGDEVREVVLAHKERGVLGLAEPLGAALAGAVRAAVPEPGTGPLLLVPVPSSRWSTVARGHDPTRRMALCAARALRRQRMPARVVAVLRQRRPVADQAALTGAVRRENLLGALRTAPGSGRLLGAGPVVLVDDVVTTGASLVEAARAVREAGGRVGAAAVVAASGRAYEEGRACGKGRGSAEGRALRPGGPAA